MQEAKSQIVLSELWKKEISLQDRQESFNKVAKLFSFSVVFKT